MQECGKCTACCIVLEIKETNSKANEICQHCNPGVGCKIYADRPQGCREFACMWLQMPHVHPDLRPDNCGIVFEKFSDDVIVGATSGAVAERVIGQIHAFNKEGFSVVVSNHATKKNTLFLAQGHNKEYVDGVVNGRSELH